MNKPIYIIPHEIIFYVREEKYSDGKKIRNASAVGSKESKARKLAALQSYSWTTREEPKEITVPNTKFTIFVSPRNADRYYVDNELYVDIASPYLEETLQMKMYFKDFFDLLFNNNNGNLIRGQIPGTYCLTIAQGSKGMVIQPILENSQDKNLNKAKEIGKAMEGRLSSRWIPGHAYATRSGNRVLYLGDINNVAISVSEYCSGSSSNYPINIPVIDYGVNYPYYSSVGFPGAKLMLLLREGSSDTYIKDAKGKDLIQAILGDILFNDNFSHSLVVRSDQSTKWTGADLGEYLTYKGEPGGVGEIIKNHCKKIIEQCKETNLSKLPEDVKKCFSYVPELLRDNKIYREMFLESNVRKIIERLRRAVTYYASSRSRDRKNITKEQFLAEYKYCIDPIINSRRDIIGYTPEEKDALINKCVEFVRNV